MDIVDTIVATPNDTPAPQPSQSGRGYEDFFANILSQAGEETLENPDFFCCSLN